MPDLGNHYSVGDTLLIPFQTRDGANAATDADSVPTYRIYERGGTTAVATGSGAKRDDANTTGYYEAEVTLSSASGFERGKFYTILKSATIGGDAVTGYETFFISGGLTSFAAITGWPTLADVEARLSDMGLTPPADATTNAMIAAAVAAWEKATRYEPFLSSGDDSTRYFRPEYHAVNQTHLVFFNGGIIAVPTSFTVNGYYDENGAYAGGQVLVVNRDYQLFPENAEERERPYTYAEVFWSRMDTRSKNVKVVAPVGFAETVPGQAWEAVMQEILVRVFPSQMVSVSGGAQRKKLGSAEVDYGSGGGTFGAARLLMSETARIALSHFRRDEGGIA